MGRGGRGKKSALQRAYRRVMHHSAGDLLDKRGFVETQPLTQSHPGALSEGLFGARRSSVTEIVENLNKIILLSEIKKTGTISTAEKKFFNIKDLNKNDLARISQETLERLDEASSGHLNGDYKKA